MQFIMMAGIANPTPDNGERRSVSSFIRANSLAVGTVGLAECSYVSIKLYIDSAMASCVERFIGYLPMYRVQSKKKRERSREGLWGKR